MLSLEDNADDILNKALKGWGQTSATLAATTGVAVDIIEDMLAGNFHPAAARQLAHALQLDATSWIALAEKRYHPGPLTASGLYQFHNPEGFAVNAYLVWHQPGDTAILFDTGEDATEMLAKIDELGCTVAAICITHTHMDHIACLEQLRQRCPSVPVYVGAGELLPHTLGVKHGDQLSFGPLTLECRSTKGHATDGISYVIHGMPQPIVIVGDAIFAGSMGGFRTSWATALETNRQSLFTLSNDTIVCPGHGPLTSIGLEKANNPFYPEFKS